MFSNCISKLSYINDLLTLFINQLNILALLKLKYININKYKWLSH